MRVQITGLFMAVVATAMPMVSEPDPVLPEVHIGMRAEDEPDSGAQLEVSGVDGGVTITATGQPFQSEAFLMHRQRGVDQNFRKSFSLSTNMANADLQNGNFITRYNTTYTVDGVQQDDLAIQQCGGHGVVFFAPYALDAHYCPGVHVMRVMGTLDVNGVNVQDEMAAQKARIVALEARLAAVTTPASPTPGVPVMIQCLGNGQGPHPACRVLPKGPYLKSWADGAFGS